MQQFHINKPTLNRHSNRHFYVSEKKSLKELLSPQIIFFFIEGSPVDNPTVLQNRGTMGVQIPFSFPKSLDFKPFQTKARFLPWHTKSTLIIKFFLLKCRDLPCFAAVYATLFDKRNVCLSSGHSTVCTFYGKSRQNKAKCNTQTDTNRIRILGKSIRLKNGAIVKK